MILTNDIHLPKPNHDDIEFVFCHANGEPMNIKQIDLYDALMGKPREELLSALLEGYSDHPSRNYKIFAVDFDGCLCTNAWPKIGAPNIKFIEFLKGFRAGGGKVILWTCREGDLRYEAVKWCDEYGLRFDAVNENLPEIVEAFGGATRKIFADVYFDDKSFRIKA